MVLDDLIARSFVDGEYPARPYPGARPPFSFVHEDGGGVEIGARDVGGFLAEQHRRPVLAYGSNACPSKITWLRENHGLSGPVVVVRVRCEGIAAVWAAGFRVVDEQRPATLAAMDGVREDHAVWLATDDQIAVLDRCEGRGVRYDLVRLTTGTVVTEFGHPLDQPLAYVGLGAIRMPLLVEGAMVRCADVAQPQAMGLRGEPAAGDGLGRAPAT